MSDGGEIFTDQYSTDATFSALAPAPLPSAPWLPLPSSPQWLSDLVTATEEWAAQVIRNNPPPCAHQYCREHGCGLCFGVPGAMADMILARPYASGDNPASPPADGWQPIGTIAGDGPALISGRDMLLAAGYTFDESLSTLAVSVQPEPEPADIVDRIDELVNDQLANYGNRSGYDHNVNQDLCPHCGREWHGLKITARIEQMRSRGRYDEDYRYADDDSEVICEGSEFIGPMKYGPKPSPWAFSLPAAAPVSHAHRLQLVRCECGWQYGAFLPAVTPFGGICRISITCQNCDRTLVVGNDIPEGQ